MSQKSTLQMTGFSLFQQRTVSHIWGRLREKA